MRMSLMPSRADSAYGRVLATPSLGEGRAPSAAVLLGKATAAAGNTRFVATEIVANERTHVDGPALPAAWSPPI